MKKTKKTLYTYENLDLSGETTFFFDERSIITSIHGNDAQYRHEYMDSLFNHFGVEVKSLNKLNKEQEKAYKKQLKELGY